MLVTRILQRQIDQAYPTAVTGRGVTLTDKDGRQYIDASSGAAVSCLGHQHPEVVEAMHVQLDRLAYAHTSFFTSTPAEELADELIERAPAGIGHVYFVSGGSEGIEAALKLARQYCVEIGAPNRRYFIGRRQSYHGNTLGALSVGGHQARRALFEPILLPAHHIDPCYAYRHQALDESPEAYGQRAANDLETALEKLGAENVIAFVAETVVGSTLGAVPAAPGYFKRIREICNRHGILLILDEVMCGMGRTGTTHACEQEGISPDLMVIAKGLGGGYAPIGAVLTSNRVYTALEQGSGAFRHGHTYIGHPLACAAGLAVQRVIRRDNLLGNVRARGVELMDRLHEKFRDNPHVGDIRGRGLFQAVELVADRSSKKPFDPRLRLHARIKAEAMQRGLMVYPSGGTADGIAGDHVLLAPPFIIDSETIQVVVERLAAAVDAALEGLPRDAVKL